MAEWLRHPTVETLVVPGSDPGLAINLFLHFFLTKMNTVYCEDPALGLDQQTIDACQETIHVFMGPAFRALDAAYISHAQDICHYWYDACPHVHPQ